MNWATHYIDNLMNGNVVKFRPHGNSMTPKIKSGALCTVSPITDYSSLKTGDVVLCRVNGKQYLHLLSAIKGEQFQISNNHGHVNGWITEKNIFGILTLIEP